MLGTRSRAKHMGQRCSLQWATLLFAHLGMQERGEVMRPFENHLDNPEFIRGMLCGLLFQCPLGGNPCDCQGHDIRLLSTVERMRWLQNLSDPECRELYRKHLICLETKLQAEENNHQ